MTSECSQPAPDDRSRPVVYFDGVCGLCNRFVDFLLRHDKRETFFFAPLQGETAAGRLAEEDVRKLNTVVLVEEGRTWKHSSAVVRIFWRLGPFWRCLGTLLWLVPRPLRDAGYRVLARSRYRLFGKRDSCRMPTKQERARFLS